MTLSYGYWQRRFGGDPRVVGRTIRVDSRPRVIAGVMPRGFKLVSYDFELMVSLGFERVKRPLAALGIAASRGCCISGWTPLRHPKFQARVVAETRALLATGTAGKQPGFHSPESGRL